MTDRHFTSRAGLDTTSPEQTAWLQERANEYHTMRNMSAFDAPNWPNTWPATERAGFLSYIGVNYPGTQINQRQRPQDQPGPAEFDLILNDFSPGVAPEEGDERISEMAGGGLMYWKNPDGAAPGSGDPLFPPHTEDGGES